MGRWLNREDRAIRDGRICNLWMRGLTVLEVAERLSINSKTVYKVLRANGLFRPRAPLPSGSPDKVVQNTNDSLCTQVLHEEASPE